MLPSQRHLDNSRLRPLSELHRELVSISEDTRDAGQIYQSGRELTVALCAKVENFCVTLLKLAKGDPSAPTDAPVPKGSGVLAFSRTAPCNGWGILTAAHVLDECGTGEGLDRIWVGSSMMMRSGDGRRPVALQRMRETYVVRGGPHPQDETIPPDIAWIGLAEADVRTIEAHGGVFFNLDSSRHTIPSETPPRDVPDGALPRFVVGVIVGTLGFNYRTGMGPGSVDGDVPLNLLMTMCGPAAYSGSSPEELESFDFQVIQPTQEYGSLGDPVANRMAPDSWKGMSGCGYWQLVFGGPQDPVAFETRLEGIVFAQLEREHDGRQCLRANSRPAIYQLLRNGKSCQAER